MVLTLIQKHRTIGRDRSPGMYGASFGITKSTANKSMIKLLDMRYVVPNVRKFTIGLQRAIVIAKTDHVFMKNSERLVGTGPDLQKRIS